MSLSMEPSHDAFERGHVVVDNRGQEIKRAQRSRRARSTSKASSLFGDEQEPTNDRDDEELEAFDRAVPSRFSAHSVYTQYSVLLADGVVNQIDDDSYLKEIPGRYEKGSVKSRVTWFGSLCLAGVGMFVEAFVIITTGQIKSIWHAEYPTCWDYDNVQACPNRIQCCGLFPSTPVDEDGTTCAATLLPDGFCEQEEYPDGVLCNHRVTAGVSYSEFAGIMAGMVSFGIICDLIGRKNAGTLTSLFMIVGISGMVLYKNDDLSVLFVAFSSFFAIFGLGVGGEYPLTASGAADHHVKQTEDALRDDEDQHRYRVLLEVAKTARRGETISLVFAMQGLGAVFGSVVLLVLIYIADQCRVDCDDLASNSTGNDPKALAGIWRGFYFMGLLFVVMLLLYRWLVLEEDVAHNRVKMRQKRREKRLAKSALSRWRLFRFYGFRLIGTGGNWFVWDVSFYGLKLYSGPIFRAINPEGSLVVQNGWLLFNNLCALAGYYCAARVIDIPAVGRKRLQMVSFAICAVLFFATAAIFDSGSTQVLMLLYFASSFFGQLGANVTTYVVAAETYPGELRATFHGMSAFLGKAGALFATILFASLDSAQIFYICGVTSVVGLILTFLFTVDLTLVSLAEHDAQLELFLEDRLNMYKGKLNDPRHLSNFEKWTGRHGEYDPKWGNKLLGRELSIKPPSLQGSGRLHSRLRSISSRAGVPVFVSVTEDGEQKENLDEPWPPWQNIDELPEMSKAEDGKVE